MNKYLPYLCFLLVIFLACGGSKTEVPEKVTEKSEELEPGAYMHINVTNYGEIVIKMYRQEVPENTANVIKLAKEGFYNGLTFHRIIEGFVIQGGCPKGDGTGGPGYKLKDEISPSLKHLKGTVAMANSGPNTNGSQFYICLAPLPRLNGNYTIIGKVVKGLDVVAKIGMVKTTGPPMDRPLSPIIMDKVWVEEIQ